METEKFPYQKEWEDYRRKAKKCWIAWLVCMPIIWLTILSIKNLPDNLTLLPVFVFVPSFLVLCWSIYKVIKWDCPKCDNSARNKMLFAQMVATNCRSCGLIKYEGSTFKTF